MSSGGAFLSSRCRYVLSFMMSITRYLTFMCGAARFWRSDNELLAFKRRKHGLSEAEQRLNSFLEIPIMSSTSLLWAMKSTAGAATILPSMRILFPRVWPVAVVAVSVSQGSVLFDRISSGVVSAGCLAFQNSSTLGCNLFVSQHTTRRNSSPGPF
jgi:hypothetical protein